MWCHPTTAASPSARPPSPPAGSLPRRSARRWRSTSSSSERPERTSWRPTSAARSEPPGTGRPMPTLEASGTVGHPKIRDPARARALADALARLTRKIGRSPVSVMHVCGSHEQAIAKFGLRATFPAGLNVLMGPGCPVCVTDVPEVDEAVVLAGQGVRVATYGDMLKVPGTVKSLADTQADGAKIDVVYSVCQAVR